MCAPARGQPQLDLTHRWVRSFPGTSVNTQSYANGVAVLDSTNPAHRGTVVVAGHATSEVLAPLSISGPPPPFRGFVAFVSPDGTPGTSWVRNFVDAGLPGTGQAVCTAAGVGSRGLINARHAFVSGWFSGDVNFGGRCDLGDPVVTSGQGKDAFLALLDRDARCVGCNSECTQWVVPFGGDGDQVALAVGVGPNSFSLMWPDPPVPVRYFTRDEEFIFYAAAGGYFTNQIVLPGFGTIAAQPGGGEEGFVALLLSRATAGSSVYRAISIPGPGHARVLAVAADPVDSRVIVAGYYSSLATVFDPIAGTTPLSYSSGTDIFVAKYCMANSTLRLDWLFTTGTTGNDGAAAVGVDVSGHVYATGWKSGQGGTRDIWIAKIAQPADRPCTQDRTTTCAWTGSAGGLVYAGSGDDAGLGVTVDGLDRVCVTGQFAATVDFNPRVDTDNRISAGGLDAFVTRLVQTDEEPPVPVQYDGTFTFGGSYDEVGSAIAIEGLRSQQLAHVGWFGAPNAPPTGYRVDFDPDPSTTCPGPTCRESNGNADAFVNTFLPKLPTTAIKAAVSLTIDNSLSIHCGEPNPPGSNWLPDYQQMMGGLATYLGSETIVPQDQRLAVNAVMFDYSHDVPDPYPPGFIVHADQILPWTVISPTNADVFARRLVNQPRHHARFGTPIDQGLRAAHASQQGDRISACYRSILVVADGFNLSDQFDASGSLRQARNDVLTQVTPDPDGIDVHQINAIAVRGDESDNPPMNHDWFRAFTAPPTNWPTCTPAVALQYLPSGPFPHPSQEPGYLLQSDAVVPMPFEPGQSWGLGLGLHTDGIPPLPPAQREFAHPTYATALQLMLKRATRCPGDFNRDGVVNSTDNMEFMAAYNLRSPAADWNFDGGLAPTDCSINVRDFHTFDAAYNASLACCDDP